MYHAHMRQKHGFTLIELSIVLVIIGLIVGGVLVGRDLISAAAVRAQITQIEKFQSATNTFKGKYNNYLPGDIPEPHASNFGFKPRGPYTGEGDGNSVLDGIGNPSTVNDNNCGIYQRGETTLFWNDLTRAGLVDGSFTSATATPAGLPSPGGVYYTTSSTPALNTFYPTAKIGDNNFMYTWSGGYGYQSFNAPSWASTTDNTNYFGISAISYMSYVEGIFNAKAGMTVGQAYAIDKKIDDGLPQSGRVMPLYTSSYWIYWAAGGVAGSAGASGGFNSPTTAATAGSATTCYDNNNVGGATQQYSITQNNGNGTNCALSIKFQ